MTALMVLLLCLLVAEALTEIGLRVAAKRRGRSIPYFTPNSMEAPKYENERFNSVDKILSHTVRPLAFVFLALGLFAAWTDHTAAGLPMVCIGILGANARPAFFKWCLVFAERGDETPALQTATT